MRQLLERESEHVTEVEKEKTRSKARTKLHHGVPMNKMEGLTLIHLAAAAGHAGATQHLQELGITRPNAPKAAPAVSTPRLERGDAANLVSFPFSFYIFVCFLFFFFFFLIYPTPFFFEY